LKNPLELVSFDAKEFIRIFEKNLSKACSLIETSLGEQNLQFLENKREKELGQLIKTENRKEIKKFAFIKRRTLNPDYQSAMKRSDTIRMMQPKKRLEINSSSSLNFKDENGGYNFKNEKELKEGKEGKDSKKTKKGKIKKKHIGNLLDQFLEGFYNSYSNAFLSASNQQALSILNEGYVQKIEKLKEYNDQRIDFELMMIENPNETIKKSIQQLLNSIRLDNEKDVISINHSTNTLLNKFVNSSSSTNIQKEETINAATEEMIHNLVGFFS